MNEIKPQQGSSFHAAQGHGSFPSEKHMDFQSFVSLREGKCEALSQVFHFELQVRGGFLLLLPR
jgi:hypothetical protein